MNLVPLYKHLKIYLCSFALYGLSIVLRGQSSGEGSMTQFYIVIIVFAAIIVGALISFLFSQKKKKRD